MNLAIVSCRCDPLTSIKFRMFLHSARYFGYPDVIWYQGTSDGSVYHDFADAKVNRLLPVLEDLRDDGYTHVLYTDSTDAFFVELPSIILIQYHYLGSPPILFSRERGCYPHQDLIIPEHLQFPNTGQYMGEITALIDMWTSVREKYGKEPDNEQGWMLRACADGIDIALDTESLIFRADAGDYNSINPTCMVHFNGGYSDPERGKYDAMLPLFMKLFGEEPNC